MVLVKDSGGELELVPAGTHRAVCVGSFDLGFQPSNNPQYKSKRQVLLRWEIDKVMSSKDFEGKRFCVSKFYTNSLNEKSNLSKDIESWRGVEFTQEERKQGFDTDEMKGKACMLSVAHNNSNGKTRAVIKAVMAMPDGVEPILAYDMLNEAPEWVKKIQARAISEDEVNNEPIESDLPF